MGGCACALVVQGGCVDVVVACFCSDLVIGAYEARQVVVLRSRTVVVIDTTITSSTTQVSIVSDAQKRCVLGNTRYDW